MISSGELLEDRTGEDEMSERSFLFTLGLYVVGGLFASAACAMMSYHWQGLNNIWALLGLGLALPILGIIISFKSDNWLVSSIGYLLVVVPWGIVLGPLVAVYEINSVLQVLAMTVGITAVMWILGVIIPPITKDWGALICGAILLLIFGDLARMFMVSQGFEPVIMGIWDWVAVVLFTGLILYDVNKARQLPYTLDNAVDSATGIYLDILNVFIRLLAATGKRSD